MTIAFPLRAWSALRGRLPNSRTLDLWRWRARWFLLVVMPHLTPQRLLNALRVEWAYRRRSLTTVGRPTYAIIDPTNLCNLSCPLCPTGVHRQGRNLGQMRFDAFKHAFDQLSDELFVVQLYNWGESFLVKDLYRMVAYARERNVATMVSANFNLIDNDDIDGIIASGLTHLVLSIDGASDESYPIYRKGGDFSRVMDNVRRLVAAKRRRRSRYPVIQWQFIVMRHNEHEIEKARQLARHIGVDAITFYTRVKPMESVFSAYSKEGQEEDFQQWVPVQHPEYAIDFNAGPMNRPCPWLWKSTVVNWDGGLSPCCVVDSESSDIGNVSQDAFNDLWNGSFMRDARAHFQPKFDTTTPEVLCSTCTLYAHHRNGGMER